MGFFHTIFLSDSFRPVRPLPFGNPYPVVCAIIKSRLCRKAAKGGGVFGYFCRCWQKYPAGGKRWITKSDPRRGAERPSFAKERK